MTEPPEDDDDPIYEVEDSGGLVARKKKQMIIDSRKKINEAEYQLRLGGTPKDLKVNAQTAYHQVVRQFLRNIEPLLANSNVSGATVAYEKSLLGYLSIQPPVVPNETSKPEHLQSNSKTRLQQQSDSDLALHRFSDPVDVETFEITGLREIIVKDGKTASWDVVIDKKESKGFEGEGPKEIRLTASKEWDYEILNNAVRTADQFLDNANIGLSLSEGEPDDGFLDL